MVRETRTRRQAVRKPSAKQPISWWQQAQRISLQISVIAGFIAVVGVSAYGAKHLYTLPIEQVVISGTTDHVPTDLIETLVAPTLAGGFFAADLDAIRDDLERIPWVYRAAVRRQWPDTVVVTVEEQRPIARWGSQGFLNHEGAYFAGDQSAMFDPLPQLAGPDSSAGDMMRHYQQVEGLLQDTGLQVVRLEQDENQNSVLRLHGRKGAGVISSLQGADGLVEIPLDCAEVAPGDMLRFLPFRERGL